MAAIGTALQAAQAYQGVVEGRFGGASGVGGATGGSPADFGAALSQALQGAVDSGHAADAQSMQALAGHGNITDLVTAVSKAELALQTTIGIRDRMVQAYQDIMKMPI